MYTWLPLASNADLAKLEAEITAEYSPKTIFKKLMEGLSEAVKGVLVERNYIDKDYRSTYYNFYSKKGMHYLADCVRLHFFDETVGFDEKSLRIISPDSNLADHYFGYMVLRPTGIATIGRSVLSPDIKKGISGPMIHATHKVHLLGHKLSVVGFPSMDQHIDISVCAHAACWSILRHYSERYSNYREFLTHDITLMAQQFNPGGLVPSKGLEVSHAERVFQQAATFPVVITRDDQKGHTDRAFYRQLLAYIESGFPLFAAMHSREHAIALVGYDWKPKPTGKPPKKLEFAWDLVRSLTVVDDNFLAYRSVPLKAKGTDYGCDDIDAFIVPLPEKVFYPADAVDRLAPTLFKLGAVLGLPPETDCTIRYFITTGSALRHFMRDRESEFDPKLLQTVMVLPFAQFIWVVEIATKADWEKGQISARAILDATASLRETFPFWLFHSRTAALVFDRQAVNAELAGLRALKLAGMENTALTRWDQNLRLIQSK